MKTDYVCEVGMTKTPREFTCNVYWKRGRGRETPQHMATLRAVKGADDYRLIEECGGEMFWHGNCSSEKVEENLRGLAGRCFADHVLKFVGVDK